jgi:hypothetical protein
VLEPVSSFRWSEVQRVVGYKADIFAYDLICIAFELSDRAVEIHEEMEGYNAVVAELPARFPGMTEDWWSSVAFPAFATNLTPIWQKQQSQS